MSIHKVIHIFLAMFVLALRSSAADVPASPPAKDPLVWDAIEKHTAVPAMTNVVYFTFWVTNVSTADVSILSTETYCDCTVAEAASKLPWVIKPGEGGWFRILVSIKGEYGVVNKTATIHTSFGSQLLTVSVDIPLTPAPYNISARILDQMASQKDRQAIFGEHCEVCHSWPARGRTGEALFQAVCAVCHVDDHRAQMVPDLAMLNFKTNPDFWRTNIIFGRTNTFMAAFAQEHGGILDTNQVESLVTYLVKRFPSKKMTASIDAKKGSENP